MSNKGIKHPLGELTDEQKRAIDRARQGQEFIFRLSMHRYAVKNGLTFQYVRDYVLNS